MQCDTLLSNHIKAADAKEFDAIMNLLIILLDLLPEFG